MVKIILGCDTSCDDTAIGIIRVSNTIEILSNVKYSQETSCLKYGGVVPEVSARNHLENIQKTFLDAIYQADISIEQIDIFAATIGPGLIGGVLIGSTFIQTLSDLLKKPFIPVHHLEGHIASCGEQPPFIALIISGGHSLIASCDENYNYKILCNTLDDSAGEVFDKIGRLIDLPFPAGPHIEKLATKATKFFDCPNITTGQLSFSFSGLKTRCKNMLLEHAPEDVAYFLQNSVAQHLKQKLDLIQQSMEINKLVVCGGVANNSHIRNVLNQYFSCVFPPMALCMDNGVMIAMAANISKKNNKIKNYLNEFASMSLESWQSLSNL